MIDFTNIKEIPNSYGGSENKKALVYNNKKYLVKFPDPIREKNKTFSYINNAYSEYIGSNIFKICGFDVQNTILGKYIFNGKEKIVCACEDFTDFFHDLIEFKFLKDFLEIDDIEEKFWDMFVIDALIGNTNRHNGNWGFISDLKNNKFYFSTIYDCGSCLK